MTTTSFGKRIWQAFVLVITCEHFTGIVAAKLQVVYDELERHEESQGAEQGAEMDAWRDFPWLDMGQDGGQNGGSGVPLVRVRRSTDNSTSKNIWEEIEEFYSDKNNMAMYCVLPIMVLVYGGCSAIYCVHKCRQYMKGRKHKRLKEDEEELTDKNDLSIEDNTERPVSQISQAWGDLQAEGGGPVWSGHTDPGNIKSPLPWQMSDKAAAASAATALAYERERTNSRAEYLEDKLREDDINLEEGRRSQNGGHTARSQSAIVIEEKVKDENVQMVAAVTVASSSTDDDLDNQQQQRLQPRPPPPPVRLVDQKPFEASRVAVNLTDYTASSSATKATDYSRFAESKPIEIVPLSADPNLRVWDPLHKRPYDERGQRQPIKVSPLPGPSNGRNSAQDMKEEMLARYDALSTFQMAKKAAEILKTNAVEKSPFQRKPNKKKHIFIAE